MLTPKAREELIRQKYAIVGEHSAVKICTYTKNMLRGHGGCYKLKFYGIMSHQCMQMTTSISCANRCTFCWRGYKAPVSKEWKWGVDDPVMVLEGALKAHHKFLGGFGGNGVTSKALYNQSLQVKHVALSLTGEPIIYPRINELLTLCNKAGISTFLVTNAQYHDAIRNLAPVTQLYLSLDAPTKEMLKKIDLPLFSDYWERLLQSLDILSQKKQRTTIRLTHIKGLNDNHEAEYAQLIIRGSPDFIEIKGYSWIGSSRKKHTRDQMPSHDDVILWAKKLLEFLPDYEIVTDFVPSAVVMLAKKKFKIDGKWQTWIDFDKWHELCKVGDGLQITSDMYLKKTPQVGLSDITTDEYRKEMRLKKEAYAKKFKDKKESDSRVIGRIN